MKKKVIGLPAGFRDVLFDEAKERRRVEAVCASVFDAESYREVSPSGIEFLETYTRGNQSLRERAIKFLDRDENLVALRADFTPAIARIVSTRFHGADLPIKLWYAGSVYRRADQKHGGFFETKQVGAELLGLNTIERDAELLTVAFRCLDALGISNVQVHINHAGIFRGIVQSLRLDEQGLDSITSEIDRKDVRALAARLESLGVPGDVRRQFNLLTRAVGGQHLLTEAASEITNEESRRALADLERLAALLTPFRERLVFDLSEIDEMEYYTGVMFTFFSPKLTKELGGGGRYDALLGEFGAGMPAVGFSLTIDRLAELA